MERIQVDAFDIVVGTESCNAHCPFCVSRMTPDLNLQTKDPQVNWKVFHKGYLLAREWGATTALITGKGEPLLYPNQITQYLEALSREKDEMPLIELQTNGILLSEQPEKYHPYLQKWYDLGLNLIALSVVHFEGDMNRQIYLPNKPKYPDLPTLIDTLHQLGFSVRLSDIMIKGFIDQPKELEKMINFARENQVEQLTVRPVSKPQESRDGKVAAWVESHSLTTDQLVDIGEYLRQKGDLLQQKNYGALIYDVAGQNVCLTNCLTIQPESNAIRQLIFSPDGHLYYDWVHKGAIII